jgi:hypothetical protein
MVPKRKSAPICKIRSSTLPCPHPVHPVYPCEFPGSGFFSVTYSFFHFTSIGVALLRKIIKVEQVFWAARCLFVCTEIMKREERDIQIVHLLDHTIGKALAELDS